MKRTNYEAHYIFFSRLLLEADVEMFPRRRLKTQTLSVYVCFILFLLTENETCCERMMIDTVFFRGNENGRQRTH